MTTKYSVKRAYKNKDRGELLEFQAELKSILTTHPNKLHTVLFDGKLHAAIKRRVDRELDDDSITEPLLRAARVKEALEECDEEAYAILYQNVSDAAVLKYIRRNHDEKGHAAWEYIQSLHDLEDNDTRITATAEKRNDLIDDGLTEPSYPTVKAWVEAVEEYNVALEGTAYEMPPALFTTKLLDALSMHLPEMVRTYKTRMGRGDWRTKFDSVRDEIYVLLEEDDRTNARSASATKRNALRTGTSSTTDLATQLAATQKQLAELTAKMDAAETRNAFRASPRGGGDWSRPPCPDCDRVHATTHGCIGKRIIDGEITIEQAAKLFTSLPEDRRLFAANAAKAAAETVAAKKKSKAPATTATAPGTIKPTKKVLGMCTRVVRANLSAPTDSVGGEALALTSEFQRLGMDSKCDQHIFTDKSYFPLGMSEPECTILIQTVDGEPSIKAKGVGTAVVATRDGIIIHFANSLYVPDALRTESTFAGLASVEQAYQARAEVRFGGHRDIIFHAEERFPDGYEPIATVPLDAGYDLIVRPLRRDELEEVSTMRDALDEDGVDDATADPLRDAEDSRVIEDSPRDDEDPPVPRDPITRGRGGGGTATLSEVDTARLWSMRMPGLSADRLQKLPDITADAPAKLRKASAEHIADGYTLTANAPKIHAPPVQRRVTSHRGELTMTDLIGPFEPSKFYGNRYGAPHIDLHQGTTDVAFLSSKDKYPSALRSYVIRNQGTNGCDFRGGTLYRDNEAVLNSAKTDVVLKEFDMVSKNSAEYEPWTNPAERTMRTLQEPMRVMLARGHAGPEYWEFTMSQAKYIADDSHHSWGRDDDGKTPTERRTGHPPSLAGRFRPMFCLAYVPLPRVYRTSKLDKRAEKGLHLGINPKGPGWRFEILEGPRKGRLVVSTQAVFREFQFPLAPSPDDDDTGSPSADDIATLYPDDDDDDVTGTGGRRDGRGGGDDSSGADDTNRGDDDSRGADANDGADRGDDADRGADRGDDDADRGADRGDGADGDDDELPGLAEDDDISDDEDERVDGRAAPVQPQPRRSQRLASTDELPAETFQYQRFRGVLHTQSKTVPVFSTSVDMTDGVDPSPLLLEAPCIPTPTPHDPQKLPKTFAQIMAIADSDERDRRLKAYYKEYDGLMEARSGFRVVPKPEGPHKTLKLKEIPSTKKDGTAKLRVVARGDLLKHGIDYDRTFSPTVKHTTLRVACAIAAKRNQTVSGADVTQAYPRADWPTDEPTMYADRFPDGYEPTGPDGEQLVLEIGNLYGKPTAGRNWYKKAAKELLDGLPDAGEESPL